MNVRPESVVVAGHICLDIIPTFKRGAGSFTEILQPGKLVDVGAAALSTGGAVANTGIALHRLGVPVRLVGKTGDDIFADSIMALLERQGSGLSRYMVRDAGVSTSYSIVLSPPDLDRLFLHCPGANDTFVPEDLPDAALEAAGLLHFGYPPLMKSLFEDGGAALSRLLRRAKEAGLTTSLDMALPDPDSPAGQVDWRKLLEQVLPQVDVFVPSLEEITFMLDRELGGRVRRESAAGSTLGGLEPQDISRLADRLVEMGTPVVLLKLGRDGAYLRTTADAGRLRDTGRFGLQAESWHDVSRYAPCYSVKPAGTTGAGDSAIAGFLAAVAQGCGPDAALRYSVAAGAASVEHQDGSGGLPSLDALTERIENGWQRDPAAEFPEII